MDNEIIIYQEEGRAVEVRLDGNRDTVRLTQTPKASVHTSRDQNS